MNFSYANFEYLVWDTRLLYEPLEIYLCKSLIINGMERKELESLNLLNANQMLYQLS